MIVRSSYYQILNLGNYNVPNPINKLVKFTHTIFPGGEPNIKIESDINEEVTILAKITGSKKQTIIDLACCVDACRRVGVKKINVVLPYFPGARQDRIISCGEALTVKVYADIINSLKLDSILIIDPHSDVTPALLNNCQYTSGFPYIDKVLQDIGGKNFNLVIPDFGATKKLRKLFSKLKGYDWLHIVQGEKTRDINNKLSGFDIIGIHDSSYPYVIFDDICDGGGTFIGLANELPKDSDKYLAITHGIFSKGIMELTKSFKKVYTTNSISELEKDSLGSYYKTNNGHFLIPNVYENFLNVMNLFTITK